MRVLRVSFSFLGEGAGQPGSKGAGIRARVWDQAGWGWWLHRAASKSRRQGRLEVQNQSPVWYKVKEPRHGDRRGQEQARGHSAEWKEESKAAWRFGTRQAPRSML